MLENAPALPKVTLTLGVGYTDETHGASATSVPGEVAVSFDNDRAVFLLNRRYDWAHSPQGNLRGMGDPSATIVYRLTPDRNEKDTFAVAGSVGVPSGTEVSSGAATQSLSLLWNPTFSTNKDSIILTAIGEHTNGALPPGVSVYTAKGELSYQHNFSEGTTNFAKARLSRTFFSMLLRLTHGRSWRRDCCRRRNRFRHISL